MKINSYQAIQSIPTSQTATQVSKPRQPTSETGVQVSISAQAQQLAKADNGVSQTAAQPPVQLPIEPQKPLTGEKLEQAVQFKKAKAQYQVASDMVNILMPDNSNNMSASTAYYLSENQDARDLVLNTKSQQQTMANMQAYQEQTAALNEQYTQ